MKKIYQEPSLAIENFENENIVTTSGNVAGMKKDMEDKGYTVSAFSLEGLTF